MRPLSLADILDGAARAVRHNPRPMLGLAFLVTVLVTVVGLLARAAVGYRPNALGEAASGAWLDPSLLTDQFGALVLTGIVTFVVAESVLGRRASTGAAWAAVKGRLLPLMGYQLLLALAVLGPLVALAWAFGAGGSGAVALVLVLVVAALIPLLTVLFAVPPVIVLEGQTIGMSIRRSVSLVRGAFWRTLGVLSLTNLLAAIAAALLAFPLLLALGALVVLTGVEASDSVLTAVDAVIGVVAGAVVTPFTAAAGVLLYVDRRIRAEGLDVLLIRQARRDAGPGR